jgi:glucose dehydrogenase
MSVTREVDVCVIGGGVAGAILAFQLSGAGIDVFMLEAGPWHDPAQRFDYMKRQLYGSDPWASNNPERDRFTLGGPYRWYDLNQTRVKGVGGSGLHWGGHTGRLHESDFELHTRYGIGVDWPIRYPDLERYYTQAETIIGVAGHDAYPLTPWRSTKYPMPPFPFSYSDHVVKRAFDRLGIPLHHTAVARNSVPYDHRSPCVSFAMCQTCPVFARWTPDLLIRRLEKAGKVTVKSDTRVVRIHFTAAGTAVERVTAISTEAGTVGYVDYRAKIFVLAAHAVESTRLLLLARDSGIRSLDSELLGRNLMEHPIVIGKGELQEQTYPERIGFDTAESQHFYESSRREGGTAFVLGPANRDVQTPLDIVNEELSKKLIWGEELKTIVQRRFGSGVLIAAMIEQLPHRGNLISLDDAVRDDLGFPVPRLTYTFDQERELWTIERASVLIRRLLEALGATRIRMQTGLAPGHQTGVCRMGNDPRSSVVDRDLRLHGVRNLYLVGGSVFPTSGAVAPTLTIAALALRLGDRLANELRRVSSNRGRTVRSDCVASSA